MTDLIARLKDAAGKASPGEWRYGRLGTETLEHVVDFGPQPKPPFVAVPPHGVCHGADESGPANAAYIIAAQPTNILALTKRVEELEAALHRLFARSAFMVATTGDGKPYIKIEFGSSEEMWDFHQAMVDGSALSKAATSYTGAAVRVPRRRRVADDEIPF